MTSDSIATPARNALDDGHMAARTVVRFAPTLRRGNAADARAITALINAAFQVESFFVDGDRVDEVQVLEMLESGLFLLIECTDGGLAASIYLEISGRRGYFGLLSVQPDYQGYGLGKRLVAVAEGLCVAEGCTNMDLSLVNLRAELKPWYHSLGYRECGTEPFPGGDTKIPCHMVRMSKDLAA